MGYRCLIFPENSRFLVSGGAGFIGSNLCEALLGLGVRVRCLDDLSTGCQNNIDLFIDNPNYEFTKGDIKDVEICLKATKDVDFVLHQAAWGSVPRSIEYPLLYESNNVLGTLNMMEAARQNGVKKFIYASSSSVYGDSEASPKKEGAEGGLLSPYALTKRSNEEYGKLYWKLYGLQTYGLRYFNVFGKRQNPDGMYAAVIPKWIKLLLNNEQPVLYGDGGQSRDFTYIENVVEANLKACFTSDVFAGQVFNIACGEQTRLIDVYHSITNVLGVDTEPRFDSWRKGDIRHSDADITKAKTAFGYSPEYSFDVGLKETIEWFVRYITLIY